MEKCLGSLPNTLEQPWDNLRTPACVCPPQTCAGPHTASAKHRRCGEETGRVWRALVPPRYGRLRGARGRSGPRVRTPSGLTGLWFSDWLDQARSAARTHRVRFARLGAAGRQAGSDARQAYAGHAMHFALC